MTGLTGALAGLARTGVPPGAQEAVVTALRADGRVNVRDMWGGHLIAVEALDTYTSRAVGDTVLVSDAGGRPCVVGRVGPDPEQAWPANSPTVSAVYTPAGVRVGGVDQAQQGASGDPGDTLPLSTGWHYGTALSTAASSATSMWVWLVRDAVLHGDYGPQRAVLFLHDDSTPPDTGFGALSAYAPIAVSLEVGEVLAVPVPSAWISALAAGTARGFGAGDASGQQVPFIRFVGPSGGYTTT